MTLASTLARDLLMDGRLTMEQIADATGLNLCYLVGWDDGWHQSNAAYVPAKVNSARLWWQYRAGYCDGQATWEAAATEGNYILGSP